MKKDFPKILSAFILFLTFCFLQANAAQAAAANIADASSRTVNIGAANNNHIGNGNKLAARGKTNGLQAVPAISINNVSFREGDSGTTAFVFTVTLSEASSDTVSVNYTSVDGTATAPSDFQFVSSAISFAPGETSKLVVVLVNNDTQPEADETFTVILSDAVNAVIANGTGVGTILNDDTPPTNCTFSISPGSLNVNANGSSGNIISVATQPGCSFTAVSSNSFITINSGASGVGTSTVSFNVAPNSGAARTGTITVAGQTFFVNQSAAGSSGLRVSIIDSPDPVTFGTGQDVTYTIFVNNEGPAPATGVVVTNNLPVGFDFVSATSSVGSCGNLNRVVTCNLGNVSDIATISIVARPNGPGTFTDTVSVSGNEADPNPNDNTASTTTTVNSQPGTVSADLRVNIFDSPGGDITLGSGQNITYSIFVDNDGPSPATGVVVTSTLSSNLDFVSASSSGGACAFAARVVTCNIGNLLRGTTIVVTARPNAPGTASNTVTARGNEFDPIAFNNTVTDTKTINPPVGTAYADLRVTVLEPLSPSTFENVNYEIFVSNDGPSPATGVVLRDTLPTNTSFVSATVSQGSCSQENGIVTCNLGTVTGNVSLTITVRTIRAGTASNTATVTANEPDFNASNNSVTTNTPVSPSKSRKRTRIF